MKMRLVGIFACLATVICIVVPVWSQDSPQPAEQPSAVQGDELQAPAAPEEMLSAIKIEDAVVCLDVVDRAPVGSSEIFNKETGKVYCFCRVVGAQPDTQITHNWYYKGSLKASVKLTVRSSNYRTWSSKTLMPQWIGEWMVEILSEDGKPMESITFLVQ